MNGNERISYRVLWFVNETTRWRARCPWLSALSLPTSVFILALRGFIIWYCALAAAAAANKTRETMRCAARINTQIVEWFRRILFKFEKDLSIMDRKLWCLATFVRGSQLGKYYNEPERKKKRVETRHLSSGISEKVVLRNQFGWKYTGVKG